MTVSTAGTPSSTITIRFDAGVVDAIVRHAMEASPHECCGVLLGTAELVDESWRARNLDERPATRFLLDPRDYFNALRAARSRGVDVVGFYHSHPRSAATPSPSDLKEAAAAGDQLHIIVGLGGLEPEVRAFHFSPDGISEVARLSYHATPTR